ncbi:MAG: CbrC family protein [Mycobacteriaceae bacterium]
MYFPDPVESFTESTEPCSCCGEIRGRDYRRNVYCVRDGPEHLCPWCIADGSMAEERLGMLGPDQSEVLYLFRCSGCDRHLAYTDMG